MEGSQDPSAACAAGSLDLVYKLWLAEIKQVSGIKWLKSQAYEPDGSNIYQLRGLWEIMERLLASVPPPENWRLTVPPGSL